MITEGRGGDPVVIQELLCLASVFARDPINALQHAQGTQRNILEVADRSGDQVESGPGIERIALRYQIPCHGRKDITRCMEHSAFGISAGVWSVYRLRVYAMWYIPLPGNAHGEQCQVRNAVRKLT